MKKCAKSVIFAGIVLRSYLKLDESQINAHRDVTRRSMKMRGKESVSQFVRPFARRPPVRPSDRPSIHKIRFTYGLKRTSRRGGGYSPRSLRKRISIAQLANNPEQIRNQRILTDRETDLADGNREESSVGGRRGGGYRPFSRSLGRSVPELAIFSARIQGQMPRVEHASHYVRPLVRLARP